jgi:DNA-binding transcriptional LysR family regulator
LTETGPSRHQSAGCGQLEAAFSGQKAVQRVRRIIELSGHRSIHAAAKATGVQALSTQLLRVERATGFPIYERGVMPLTATIRGHAFIQDAKQVLAELDRHGNLSEARSDIGSPPPAANGA